MANARRRRDSKYANLYQGPTLERVDTLESKTTFESKIAFESVGESKENTPATTAKSSSFLSSMFGSSKSSDEKQNSKFENIANAAKKV
eukprot:CAMPEP_0172321392 /NCGR_PEP_ID=MMETSP1058-20130122/43242_1 /TAXON_ID=83371 /ORGANISM="Detonula confervacea, Strain CCMP 353" /LENGTH=88 /DNA_ID=CAMNT_0013036887 /DNA_START=25 /DNA_END=287 /DNA_ORIENTATION=+